MIVIFSIQCRGIIKKDIRVPERDSKDADVANNVSRKESYGADKACWREMATYNDIVNILNELAIEERADSNCWY